MASLSRQPQAAEPIPILKNPFAVRRPKIDAAIPVKELVSVLKRLITEAEAEAKGCEREGNSARLVDLRIAIAYSSQKLRSVIDGKVGEKDVEGELRQALNVLLNTIYR